MNISNCDNMEILLKEIDLVEDCIKRMTNNSFLLKGSALTVWGCLITFIINSDANQKCYFIFVILPICIAFWCLDAIYLRLEKLYRRKYNWLINNRITTQEYMFNLSPYEKAMWLETENYDIPLLKVFLSKTLSILYGTISALTFVIIYFV